MLLFFFAGTTLFTIAFAARATELIFRKTTTTTTEASSGFGEDSIADVSRIFCFVYRTFF